MKVFFPFLLILGLMMMVACKNQQGNSNKTASPVGESADLEIVELASGQYSAMETEQQMIARNDAEFKELWASLNANVDPAPELPSINFAEQTLIACFMGNRNSGGYSIAIESAEMKDASCAIHVVHTEPGAGCITTMAITQPYVIIAVNKTGIDKVDFSQETRAVDCN